MSVADRPRHAVSVLPDEVAGQQGTRAGIVSRTLAMVVDAACAAAVVVIVYGLWAGVRLLRNPRSFAWPHLSFAMLASLALLSAVVILTVTWAGTGRSPGARLMGLRVTGPDGEPPELWRSLVRAIACVAFPLGLFWSAVSARNASLQDLIVRTSVVYDWHERH